MKTAKVVITESGKTLMDPSRGFIVDGAVYRAEVGGENTLVEPLISGEKAFTKTELVEALGYTSKELRNAATSIAKKEREAKGKDGKVDAKD